ncbi:MAG: DUF1315 family protein [Reinekea sp.]|jgi:uncharacterized protein YeaC (DUF1315 family)|nr:DUF1315 family protein [Reinekea sp.]
MNFDELAKNMTPDIYSRLRESIELGRWPTGQTLTQEQKNLCLEAVIKYEISNDIAMEQRTGYIADGCKSTTETIPSVTLTDEASS